MSLSLSLSLQYDVHRALARPPAHWGHKTTNGAASCGMEGSLACERCGMLFPTAARLEVHRAKFCQGSALHRKLIAAQDDRRMRQSYAAYESLCSVVGACREGRGAPAAATTTTVVSAHRRMAYRPRTCTAPRPGLRVDGPCGRWDARARSSLDRDLELAGPT